MKILYVTTVASTMGFFKDFIKKLIDDGHTVDIATNREKSQLPECYEEAGCKVYDLKSSRSPLSKGNIATVKELQKLAADESYDIVHCHTPVAAACTRLAFRKARKCGTKVIYTAHGFHFYKGAPLKNWLIFYPVEKLCARWTDVLITINKEDFAFAQKKLNVKKVEYVPGVGINTGRFAPAKLSGEEKTELRKSLGVGEADKLLFSVGELNENKNHSLVLRAMAKLPENVHYCIAGRGSCHDRLLELAEELGLKERFHLLGRRNDIQELLNCTDVFCFPSLREGLPVSVMEAMSCGVPVVAKNIRGVKDLITDGRNGLLVKGNEPDDFSGAILKLLGDPDFSDCVRKNNIEDIRGFSVEKVIKDVGEIYSGL